MDPDSRQIGIAASAALLAVALSSLSDGWVLFVR